MAARKKRRKPIPYTKMTKELFRKEGYLVDDCERVNCWSGTKNDLFGFADLVAAKPGRKPTLIQSTSYSHHTNRVKKILGLKVGKENYRRVGKISNFALKSGFRIVVVSWKKVTNRWTPRVQEITLHDFSTR